MTFEASTFGSPLFLGRFTHSFSKRSRVTFEFRFISVPDFIDEVPFFHFTRERKKINFRYTWYNKLHHLLVGENSQKRRWERTSSGSTKGKNEVRAYSVFNSPAQLRGLTVTPLSNTFAQFCSPLAGTFLLQTIDTSSITPICWALTANFYERSDNRYWKTFLCCVWSAFPISNPNMNLWRFP